MSMTAQNLSPSSAPGATTDNPALLHATLVSWQSSDIAIVIGDVHTGFGLARLTGVLTELLREDDHLVIWLEEESYVAIYDDMIEGSHIDENSIDLRYAAGNIEITKRS